MKKKFGALSSSVNPEELSLTITSAVRLVLAILVSFGILQTTGADTVLEQIPVMVSAGYATWQGVEVLWGASRKIIVAMNNEE